MSDSLGKVYVSYRHVKRTVYKGSSGGLVQLEGGTEGVQVSFTHGRTAKRVYLVSEQY